MEQTRKQRGNVESYLSAIKRRLNLQMIGRFIREGDHKITISNDGFYQREDEAFTELETLLTEQYGAKEASKTIEHVNDYVCVVQEIYFNLGMKAGVTLLCKLTDNFETDI